jgi:FixJ family two-component response regulator
MNPIILYLVDDKEEARHANGPALQKFLGSPNIKVVPLEPYPEFSQFDALLSDPNLGGFFIDQKMRGGGVVNYNGIELAGHLRALHSKLPIYILTGYPNEDFTGTAYRVEDIVDKEDIEDRESEKAQMLKARILRRLAVFGDVLNAREQRFHHLLVKSMKESLTAEEEKELGLLETERLTPQHAAELKDAKALKQAIAELKAKMQIENLNL